MKCAPLRDGEPDCITCCISPHDNEQSLSPCSWLEALAYLNFRFAISIFFGSTVELYIYIENSFKELFAFLWNLF